MEELRLQKYIAMCGVTSRRNAEELILQGKVSVNGQVVTELGTKVTTKDKVTVEGNIIHLEKNKYYIMMNKPEGVLCSVKDDRERRCVTDLIEGVDARLFPVGRLDYETSGLLLITNDGEFMYKLTHPSFEIWKTYEAVVRGVPNESDIKAFEKGIMLEDGKTLPAVLDVVGYKGNGKNAIVEVVIREGRNRQVRRMLDKIGHQVISLKRVKIGSLSLGDMKIGSWRFMKEKDFRDINIDM